MPRGVDGVALRFLASGGYARQKQELYGIAKPETVDLAEETGEAAKFAVEEYGRGIYLHREWGRRQCEPTRT